MPKIVRVDWLDAHGGARVGWKGLPEAASTQSKPAVSFGAIIKQTKQSLVVCPHFVSGKEGEVFVYEGADADGEIAIPKKWVVKVTDLGEL